MDYTKKTTFAAFVNVDKNDKYWMDGHFEYGQDTPTLFKFNTKEEKDIVQSIAQSYIDNWGIENIELVVLEVKARHSVKLHKSNQIRTPDSNGSSLTTQEAPKKRGPKPKVDATIST